MRFPFISLCAIAALSSTAMAAPGVPKYVFEFQSQLRKCKPSCYQKEHPKGLDASKIKKVCGYIDFGFQSSQLTNGSWTPLKWLGDSTADPVVLEPCTLPSDAGGKWAPMVKEAKASFGSDDPANTRFVVPSGVDWAYSRDDNNVPLRQINFRVYAKDYNLKPNECGAFGNTVCEASGSNAALAINYIHVRLDEARQLAAKGDNKMCQVATFTAVATARGLAKFRDAKIKTKDWGTGLSYITRSDGTLTEQDLFAKVSAMSKEAEALHQKCGGASPLVTEVHGSGRVEPEFYIVANPDI